MELPSNTLSIFLFGFSFGWLVLYAIEKIVAWKRKKKLRPSIDGIDFIKSFGKIELKDGDIVVIKSPVRLSSINYDRIKVFMQDRIQEYGFKVQVLVLEEGMDLGVLTKIPAERS